MKGSLFICLYMWSWFSPTLDLVPFQSFFFFNLFLPLAVSQASKSSCKRRHQALQSFFLQSQFSFPGQVSNLWNLIHTSSEWPPETPSHPYPTVRLSISKELLQKPSRTYSHLPHYPPAAQPFIFTQTGWSLSSNQPGITVLAPVFSCPCQSHQNPWEWQPHFPRWPE